jgi:hypothetical protein
MLSLSKYTIIDTIMVMDDNADRRSISIFQYVVLVALSLPTELKHRLYCIDWDASAGKSQKGLHISITYYSIRAIDCRFALTLGCNFVCDFSQGLGRSKLKLV